MKNEKQRTSQQNRALHLLFTMIAERLNEAGLEMKKVLKPEVEIRWTPDSIKEYLWRPVQKIMLGKESTTQLSTKDIDQVFMVICRHLGEKFGVETSFPSIETLMEQKRSE